MAGLEIADERDAGNVVIKRFYSRVLGAMQVLQTAYQAKKSYEPKELSRGSFSECIFCIFDFP